MRKQVQTLTNEFELSKTADSVIALLIILSLIVNTLAVFSNIGFPAHIIFTIPALIGISIKVGTHMNIWVHAEKKEEKRDNENFIVNDK
jgi:hypothetical protein